MKIDSSTCGGIFDVASKETRLKEIDSLVENEMFWQTNPNAQAIIAESKQLRQWIEPFQQLKQRLQDVTALLPEAYEVNDTDMIDALLIELTQIEEGVSKLELRKMLSGEMDNNSCFLSINAGAGGTESCDWVQMLARMYQRWAARHEWTLEIVDVVEGEVAGLKSIMMKISGEFAYGYAKAEKGVHRLVRISPFDSNARRHTSFASVDITPEIADDIVVEIRPEDLRVDTYRSSGAGGQHVNKTDSAVRMTHLPTNIVVSSQSQRSQIQNRETCLKMLRSKLYELAQEERNKNLKSMGGEKKEIAWGSQIRSYVLQPYTLVKDARTDWEESDVENVLDGGEKLDKFILAYLKESA